MRYIVLLCATFALARLLFFTASAPDAGIDFIIIEIAGLSVDSAAPSTRDAPRGRFTITPSCDCTTARLVPCATAGSTVGLVKSPSRTTSCPCGSLDGVRHRIQFILPSLVRLVAPCVSRQVASSLIRLTVRSHTQSSIMGFCRRCIETGPPRRPFTRRDCPRRVGYADVDPLSLVVYSVNHWHRVRLTRRLKRHRGMRNCLFVLLFHQRWVMLPVLFGIWRLVFGFSWLRDSAKSTPNASSRSRVHYSDVVDMGSLSRVVGGGRDVVSPGANTPPFHYTLLLAYTGSELVTRQVSSSEWWQFTGYCDMHDRNLQLSEVALRVPLSVIVPRLRGMPLRSACSQHEVVRNQAGKAKVGELLSSAMRHRCGVGCEDIWAVFLPVRDFRPVDYLPLTTSSIVELVCDSHRELVDGLRPDARFQFVSYARAPLAVGPGSSSECFSDKRLIPCVISAPFLVEHVSARARGEIAVLHGVFETTAAAVMGAIRVHECPETCGDFVTILRCDRPIARNLHDFPPPPVDQEAVRGIVNGVCTRFEPRHVEEAGCAVCGRLSLAATLAVLDVNWPPINLLRRSGVAPRERLSRDLSSQYFEGPILASGCNGLCAECGESLSLGRVPKFALANGIWIGDVPPVLSGLSYAEKLLVARSRRHRCLVRVAQSGMNKLCGNMICYPNPYPKLYDVLPPHRDDLDDMLAIVFTGVARPIDEVLKRIPFLVRRNAVIAALNWLKLNNVLYRDIEISQLNMDSYEDGEIPVYIQYEHSDTNNPVESRAANDNDAAVGSTDGACAFSVAGVSFDVFSADNYKAVTALAAKHMLQGGVALGVPHGSTPDTLWRNSDLFPNMFPWLFPYGLGGLGNSLIIGEMSEHAHKRHLLLYHDKRFQLDKEFALVAFNQEQIIQGSRAGAFLSTKSRFKRLAENILSVDESVYGHLADRLSDNASWKPQSNEERKCYNILNDLDMVNCHVAGSVAAKKHQRNEVWSLVSYLGAPTWFVTFAPADIHHPLCLYYAGSASTFDKGRISLLTENDRWSLIASNASASARFFHFMVDLFISEIVRWSQDGGSGLFGSCNAYYGTVEQQGRLTLHLHVLLWLRNALSPEEIKQRLLDPTSTFQKRMLTYIDSCHQGRLVDSTKNSALLRLGRRVEELDYVSPMNSLPARCDDISMWSAIFKDVVNDLLCRTNMHRCDYRCFQHSERCKSRFPRPIVHETHVDATGYIHVRHDERRMNTVNPTLSYLLRCNTDVTCLLSGTAIKAVVAYATDYITKLGLKTPSMFLLIRTQLLRRAALLESECSRAEKGRKMVIGIINSFTSKSEIGAPMAAAYLLDYPDHYTSHEYKTVYWKGFVSEVLSAFPSYSPLECGDEEEQVEPDYGVVVAPSTFNDGKATLIAVSPIHDYMHRPAEHEGYCVYDWIRLYVKSKRQPGRVRGRVDRPVGRVFLGLGEGVRDVGRYQLCGGHSQQSTHTVYLDNARAGVVPNFVGGSLPRRDAGDRGYYCCTMLTLFKPWRTGTDLKSPSQLWEHAFEQCEFSPRQLQIMEHFNLRYECLDARDDFSRRGAGFEVAGCAADDGDVDEEDIAGLHLEGDNDPNLADEFVLGNRRAKTMQRAADITRVLNVRGWLRSAASHGRTAESELSVDVLRFSKDQWAARLKLVRVARALASTFRNVTDEAGNIFTAVVSSIRSVFRAQFGRDNFPLVSQAYINSINSASVICVESGTPGDIVASVVEDFSLNKEQQRAFRLVAEHHIKGDTDPLRMYIAGMAGTGKSRVIQALSAFFDRISAGGLLLLLAPTGTAAANIGGYTYHSAFGLTPNTKAAHVMKNKVRNLLSTAKYVFIDEVSMISCSDMKVISERLSMVHNRRSDAYGGYNIIFAGDFAQLPPVLGSPLYDAKVGQKGMTPHAQRCAIGKACWLQVTRVVVLRENMRQRELSDADDQFRNALVNMRHKQCTAADIAFLNGLVVGPTDARLEDWKYRHVSVITGMNAHRDAINDLGCDKFARDTAEQLEVFYSIDSVESGERDESGRKVRGKQRWLTELSSQMRDVLWSLPHYDSSNVPGMLKLCRGMPVIIKKNVATECGVTNGGEGVIVDWLVKPLQDGKRALDVLFIRLTNGSLNVQVDNLPPNVVPVCAEDATVCCVLPDDSTLTIRRRQVPVLPNFSMTDYASQGKTRIYNVVDLNNLRGHQAYYTALSRSAFAAYTLILQGFSPRKIQGGLAPDLLNEFRDIEILDDITRMHFEGSLPAGVSSTMRYTLIAQFIQSQGLTYNPPNMHPSLRWDVNYARGLLFRTYESDFREDVDLDARKRKRGTQDGSEDVPRKRARYSHPSQAASCPRGLKWDEVNWSCAYDSLFTALYHAWIMRPAQVGPFLQSANFVTSALYSELLRYASGESTFEAARDAVRRILNSLYPTYFPTGRTGTSLAYLAQVAMNSTTVLWTFHFVCPRCRKESVRSSMASGILVLPEGQDVHGGLLTSLFHRTRAPFCCCVTCTSEDIVLDDGPQLVVVHLVSADSNEPSRSVISGTCSWSLRSSIYYGKFHYVLRQIDASHRLWLLDGMKKDGNGSLESANIDEVPVPLASYSGTDGIRFDLAMLIYIRCLD